MCNELRVTKQQMLDFVQGKRVDANTNNSINNNKSTIGVEQPRPTKPIHNPYQKKAPSTSSQLSFSQSRSRDDQSVASRNTTNAGISVDNNNHHHFPKGTSPAKPAGPTWPIRDYEINKSETGRVRSERNEQNGKPKAATTNSQSTRLPSKNPFTAAVIARPPAAVYVPGPVPLCEETADEWIYPVLQDFPMRDYQRQISETAIFSNTLVSLPTGLGKTLIAAVVLYNYYRWFPTGKIVFMAPTLPLVNQQVKACYDIMGIPAEDTAILTGKVKADERAKLWELRRVFFCTPQTVQKDLESNRCCPKQLVCLVLDEAHKASGEYAYTQVIQQLDEGGAKYRLVGLSATPGTNIKAIQRVVDTLHIHRIEARFESDQDVKKYMHERHSEIIVVKNSTVASSVERKLSNLIGPLLDTLRQGGALRRVSGNSTVVPYNLIQARDDYMKNNVPDPRLLGLFAAAQKLVQCRADLRTHGIGVLRNRLLRLKNEPNRGVLATIVKSDGFQELFEELASSSYDPDSSQVATLDRKMNNPKLSKLDEILTEHFERARACGESSRAIVFSQWRESVSEIVEVLSVSQPLLRPRHFVGQGKAVRSSKGKQSADAQPDSTTNVGMKQSEQQQVIREFREGVHNVLVCTCIGEEGLDIGEVDLIVNYDTLRSPIRMIQRTGRTGRKRDGRVVCLVSEGHEERTFNQSKEAEVTLGRALKNAAAFKLHPNLPMFPQKPRCNEKDMSIKPGFHLSQVGGHIRPTRQPRDQSDTAAGGLDKGIWQLSTEQERIRAEQFGSIGQLQSISLLSSFPRSAIRNFLGRRQFSMSNKAPSTHDTKGLTRIILHEFETDVCGAQMPLRTRNVGASRSLCRDAFPLQYFAKVRVEKLDVLLERDPSCQKQALQAVSVKSTETDQVVGQSVKMASAVSMIAKDTLPEARPRQAFQAASVAEQVADRIDGVGSSDATSLMQSGAAIAAFEIVSAVPCLQQAPPLDQTANDESFGLPEAKVGSGSPPRIVSSAIEFNLRTPSDSSCSESDDDAVPVSTTTEWEHLVVPSMAPRTAAFTFNKEQSHIGTMQQPGASQQERLKNFRTGELPASPVMQLPSQEDSSDDECTAHDSNQLQLSEAVGEPLKGQKLEKENKPPISKKGGSVSVDMLPQIGNQAYGVSTRRITAILSPQLDVEYAVTKRNENPYVNNFMCIRNDAASYELVDTPERCLYAMKETISSSLPADRRINVVVEAKEGQNHGGGKKRRNAILSHEDQVDESNDGDTARACKPLAREDFFSNELVDTPENSPNTAKGRVHLSPSAAHIDDNIACAVCFSGDFEEDDPIIFCDGSQGGISCNVAVHMSCYLIPSNCVNIETWQCDLCKWSDDANAESKSLRPKCSFCFKSDGPLRLTPKGTWHHQHCSDWSKNTCKGKCNVCSVAGGVVCSAVGCHASAHPHCAALSQRCVWSLVRASQAPMKGRRNLERASSFFMFCPLHESKTHDIEGKDLVIKKGKGLLSFGDRTKATDKLCGSDFGAANNLEQHDSDNKPSRRRRKSFACDSDSDSAAQERAEKRRRKLARMKSRLAGECYIETEALIDSDEDMDGDEDESELARIDMEEAMFAKGFINDSSQLGYTQDELDRLDLDDTNHRALDAAREAANLFATPMLNRRMLKSGESSGRGSDQGLGKMNFIRSVLEHVRQGGDVDDIENFYQEAVGEDDDDDEDETEVRVGGIPPVKPAMLKYIASDSEDE